MAAKTTMTSGVAGRYAAALFDLAKEAGDLDSINEDMTALRDMLRDSDDLATVVRSPILSRDSQEKAITAVLQKAGAKPLTLNFVGVIARNRRLFALPDMIEAYRTMLADFRGEMTAEVTSAQPLSEAQVSELSETLSRELRKTVQIDTNVDAGLLGGLVVRVGSRMIDNSLRTKLSNMQLAMKGVG